MTGLDCYRTYLAMKQHFTNPKFDFFQYDGKVKASEEKYQERSDFYFFETMARKLTDQEVKEYLLSAFIASDDPTKVWIGDIKRSGKDWWLAWQKQRQSEHYLINQDLDRLVQHMEEKGYTFNNLFEDVGHPPLLRQFIQRRISLDTLVIMDMVLGYMKRWDKKYHDPLWEMLSFKIKKYKPFLSIRKDKYTKLIKGKFL
jgi:hypothetical protein